MFMGPSIETYKGDGHSVFLDQDPYQLALAGKFSKVSIIMGVIGWECYAMAIAGEYKFVVIFFINYFEFLGKLP